jgi:pyocin large subunit-like protein
MATAVEARAAVTAGAEVVSERSTVAAAKGESPSFPIWSETEKRTPVQNARYHWEKHGEQFPELQTPRQYVGHVRKFRDRTDVLKKVRPNGDQALYDPRSNTFGVFTEHGVPKTVFKPRDKLDYFMREHKELYEK